MGAPGAGGAAGAGGRAELDRGGFAREVRLLGLRVPARSTLPLHRELARRGLLLALPRVKAVLPDERPDRRVLLLHEKLGGAAPPAAALPAELGAFLAEAPALVQDWHQAAGQKKRKRKAEEARGSGDEGAAGPGGPGSGTRTGTGPEEGAVAHAGGGRAAGEPAEPGPMEVLSQSICLDYDYFSAEEILRQVLPDGTDVPSSFETIGHVAHLNLRDEQLPFKHVIGQVLLDKNSPKIRTVVNKVGSIENEFRVLPMEVLAGEEGMETEVRQHGLRFRLDFSKVYWNSRLETEHKRLVESFKPSDVVCDMMAGIGPFAVPAALAGHVVWANDLNPSCAHYLEMNGQINKASRLHAFCMDGRAFLRELVAGSQSSQHGASAGLPETGVLIDRVIMNLPATALEFLDAFWGAFSSRKTEWADHPLPLVHCYCFAQTAEGDGDVLARAAKFLGVSPSVLQDHHESSVREVRDVAPNKRMKCVTFRVPREVAFAKGPHPRA